MVSADRLLWCEMERATKKKRGPVKVRVTLFDAETAAVLARAEETFTSTASDEALDKLVGQVVGPARPAVSPASTGAAPAGSAAAPATSPASAAK
jgi:hypothetical protein